MAWYTLNMEFLWIVVFIIFLVALLIAVRKIANYVVRTQPPEPEDEERYIDSIEKLILRHRNATLLYITAALVSVTVILFFAIRALAPLLMEAIIPSYERGESSTSVMLTSITTLTILSVWGGIF